MGLKNFLCLSILILLSFGDKGVSTWIPDDPVPNFPQDIPHVRPQIRPHVQPQVRQQGALHINTYLNEGDIAAIKHGLWTGLELHTFTFMVGMCMDEFNHSPHSELIDKLITLSTTLIFLKSPHFQWLRSIGL